ncbi:MAG: hypothetical protein PUH54_01345 [Oscillospiraceae bacterium]|nr:hypothetical protein [Oscillospiraceae bacterium]
MAKTNKKADDKLSPGERNLNEGIKIIENHQLFGKLDITLQTAKKDVLSKGTSAISDEDGFIILNKYENHSPQEWAYIIAHCMLHLCFDNFEEFRKNQYDKKLWNMACDIYITKFLSDIKFGTPTAEITDNSIVSSGEKQIYDKLIKNGISPESNIYGTSKAGEPDMMWDKYYQNRQNYRYGNNTTYAVKFAYAVSDSVRAVINEAGGKTGENKKSVQVLASEWFINHYPLLGGLATGFKIIETGYGSHSALKNDISVAGISVTEREIYVNSASGLTLEEWKFVLAHEYLHAGLQHHERCNGREPYLWNVACDFVINGWLNEMHIGIMPQNVLYDESLKGFSAEEIYDILIKNLRKNSKLETFRGYGKGDILDEGYAESKLKPTTLDDFCRNALRSGLEYHISNGRGFIPAGLIEEIKALSMPPIPWDVELAKWFDMNFAPIEKRRTYARPSRRQNSTPDIPRPSYVKEDIPEYSRTYGVIIDTSGSMDTKLLGMALGSTASYSVAKEVPLVRVVFCDAFAYDIGYVSPEDIAGRVEVKGRGGTVIQPAVDLLEKAKDFPKNAPILIITDGYIEENLEIHREHAFLIPKGNRLPFRAKGKVFYFDEK